MVIHHHLKNYPICFIMDGMTNQHKTIYEEYLDLHKMDLDEVMFLSEQRKRRSNTSDQLEQQRGSAGGGEEIPLP